MILHPSLRKSVLTGGCLSRSEKARFPPAAGPWQAGAESAGSGCWQPHPYGDPGPSEAEKPGLSDSDGVLPAASPLVLGLSLRLQLTLREAAWTGVFFRLWPFLCLSTFVPCSTAIGSFGGCVL